MLGFRLELVDEFTKIVLSAFGPFIGHHQELLACIKSVLKCLYVFIFLNIPYFRDTILFPLIAFCFLNSSASQFYPTLCLRNFVML